MFFTKRAPIPCFPRRFTLLLFTLRLFELKNHERMDNLLLFLRSPSCASCSCVVEIQQEQRSWSSQYESLCTGSGISTAQNTCGVRYHVVVPRLTGWMLYCLYIACVDILPAYSFTVPRPVCDKTKICTRAQPPQLPNTSIRHGNPWPVSRQQQNTMAVDTVCHTVFTVVRPSFSRKTS